MKVMERLKELGVLSVARPEYGSEGVIVCSVFFSDEPEKEYLFGATKDDVVEYGRIIYEAALDGAFGKIAPCPKEKKDAREMVDFSDQVHSRLEKAELMISELRRSIDEVEFGLIEDASPSYRERMRAWVLYRKQLNDLDLSRIGEIPPEPRT